MIFLLRASISAVALLSTVLTAGLASAEPLSKPSDNHLRFQRGVVYAGATFLRARGGTAPHTFSVDASKLPSGLSVSPAGALSGLTCAGDGEFALGNVKVTDAAGASESDATTTLRLDAAPEGGCALGIGAHATTPVVGQPYRSVLRANGGTAPYTFTITAGALPAGLVMSPDGVVSGTPTTTANHKLTIAVRDARGATGALSTVIAVAAITLAPANLAAATVGAHYNQSLAAAGGTGPYEYSVSAGGLPPGLSLSDNGRLTGTPLAPGKARFTLTAVGADGAAVSRSYTMGVASAMHASAGTPSNGLAGMASPPSGLFSAVVPANMPVATAAAPVVVSRDPQSTQGTGERPDANGALDVQPRALALPQAGVLYSAPLMASGGTGPYRFEILSGALPPGVVLDGTTGEVRGRARRAGNSSVTVRVSDADGDAIVVTLALSVGERPDASADPTVAGLQSAESEALKRLGGAQMRNVLARLDGDLDCRPEWEQRVHLNTDWRDARPLGANESLATSSVDRPGCTRGPSIWAAGAVDYGRVAGSELAAGSRFSTPGLTAGIDLNPLRGVRSGVALGHGQDRSEIGAGVGRVDSRSESVTTYGSWQAPLNVRVNAALGQSRTTLDLQRTITGDLVSVTAQRRVMQRFAALGGSTRFDVGAWRMSPRMGIERISASLDAYGEGDSSPLALAYDATRLASSDVHGGLALTRQWKPALWTVEPALSVDWHKRLQGSVAQPMRYTDDSGGGGVALTSVDPTSEFALLGLGVRLSHPLGWSFSLGARNTLDGGALRGAGYSAGMLWPF